MQYCQNYTYKNITDKWPKGRTDGRTDSKPDGQMKQYVEMLEKGRTVGWLVACLFALASRWTNKHTFKHVCMYLKTHTHTPSHKHFYIEKVVLPKRPHLINIPAVAWFDGFIVPPKNQKWILFIIVKSIFIFIIKKNNKKQQLNVFHFSTGRVCKLIKTLQHNHIFTLDRSIYYVKFQLKFYVLK